MLQTIRFKKYGSLFLLGLIISLALHLRLTTVIETEIIDPVRADATQYLLYAINLKKFSIYSNSTDGVTGTSLPLPDADRPPVYPLFISVFINGTDLTKQTFFNISLSQAVISSFAVLLIFFIFAPLFGKKVALGITLLTAISPHLVNMNIYLLSETLFGMFIIVFFWVLNKLHRDNSKSYLLAILGTSLAVASLTRPWLQYFIIFLLPLLYFYFPKPYRLKSILIFTASFAVILGIWIIRNIYSIEASATNEVLINSIHHGIYPDLKYQDIYFSYPYPYLFDPKTTQITQSLGALFSEVWARFLVEPGEYLYWYLIGKPVNLFSWAFIQGEKEIFIYTVAQSPYFTHNYFQWSQLFMKSIHNFLMLLALLGSISVWLPYNKKILSKQNLFFLRVISALIMYFTFVHILVAPLPRYSVPIRPLMYGMAFLPLIQIGNWFKKRTH